MDALKTLLIDHHDSYTYNLFQLLTEVNGEEPVVVLHDSPECLDPNLLDLSAPSGPAGLSGLSGFDNIVVSPGPGHPADPRDFGATARLIERSPIPVLGVCLGHQGIALGAQARVVPAPEPRHGHLSRIRHGERGLFRGLPQDFTAVRYHSLCVAEPLPLPLQAIAWSEDGVLMALRHRTRPLWGVQFHPESVLTGYGHRILANFRDLTREYAAMTTDESSSPPRAAARPVKHRELTDTAPAAATPPPVRQPAVAEGSVGYRLHSRWLAVPIDTEAAFTRLYADAPRAFWLDSARTRSGEARFSFLGDGRGPLAEFVRYDVGRGACEVERAGKPVTHVPGSVFDYLKKELARRRVAAPTLPFDFTGGYIGYFGYELKADCGSANRHEAKTPDACWLFADRFLAVDHQEGVTYALCLAEDTPDGHREAAEWLDNTITTLTGLPVGGETAPPPPASGATTAAVEPWLVRDRERYLADIEACQRELRAGTSYEICLTDSAWLPAPDDSYAFYRALRRLNPAPYAAFLRFGEADVACASPERFLRVGPDGTAEARPIKGTAPRGRNADEDARARATLATSPKTRAENLMIVDLLRNDLGRVCAPGSVRVPDLMHTETYATVHQLVSTVRGRLREDSDAVDCVRACFPGGSMTGAPKERTLEIIDTLETEARGVYSGALGFLSCNGAADLNIVIRTAVFTDGRMHIGAGGAIVLASDPAEEYQEMLLKTAATMRAYHDVGALPPAEPLEPTVALVAASAAASAPAEEADR
ncbi:putative para-aminonezoic acid synthase [Streptomyces bingchenggensis BCW-1]|uniref:aminodeoxychorismate synthase n=1 Tax=Streptomyces bingchenggensis (strain BCW-1) TaxID=749414 RepID=D7CFM4_STRBB|nr:MULTISPECIES: aminodeoxychorismate synthase component I [Streptomyces]ADI04760.1 putative para-aminonezoic acid synthase [Streptomyces bingchenggensis BCW-1]